MQSSWSLKSAMIFFSLSFSLCAQPLEQAWQSYMATSAEISTLQATRNAYFQVQVELKSAGTKLQRNSVWYNAWLNKLLLASNSDRQLAILDSLDVVNGRLDLLLSRQKTELVNLKQAYEEVLSSYEEQGVVLETQRETSRRVGNWLLNQPSADIQLPDYSDLVNANYKNKELRQLVLADVQQLLLSKIAQLDSLLEYKEAEAELAVRLAEFHQDLGLQMEADQDVQKRDASGESSTNLKWFNSASPTGFADEAEANLGTGASSFGRQSELSGSIDLNVQRDGLQSPRSAANSKENRAYLKAKQLEYEALLTAIKKELNHSP